MFNQSYSSDNFRKIFDFENRKGNYLEGRFFPEIEIFTQKIKKNTVEIRNCIRNKADLGEGDYSKRLHELNEEKLALKNSKEDMLTRELEAISNNVTSGDFQFKVRKTDGSTQKSLYKLDNDACSFFASKQLQFNIKKLYKVQQSNRYNIVCQLKAILGDEFPKVVFKTDIKDFFEDLDTDNLLRKINSEQLLAFTSKSFLRQIMRGYYSSSGLEKGIPRGIGISAYLSELYMRQLDGYLSDHSEVIFFARYVDDIIVVISPKPGVEYKEIISSIEQKIDGLGLTINKTKTETFDFLDGGSGSFDYLGYNVTSDKGNVALGLSAKRVEKYKKRIDLSFNEYDSKLNYNEKKARKTIIKRLRYLTGNTRLLNNKKHVLVGACFSNSLITDSGCLKEIDDYKNNRASLISNKKLASKLINYSFQEGFNYKKFSKFSAVDLERIVKVWKYVS